MKPTLDSLDKFTRAYIEALYFADTGLDSDTPSDAELSAEALAEIVADCSKFQLDNAADLAQADCQRGTGEYSNLEQAGHDFYFTRNGAGVGFWDGDWSEPYASRLDTSAKAFGESQPYAGDDGLIYLTS